MNDTPDEIHLTKLERILALGIVGCLLLATWESCSLLVTKYLVEWVKQNEFYHKRIVYYGVAFSVAIPVVILAARSSFSGGRFAATIIRALLWYGVILLLSAIAVFVFDCLPEVVAGFFGATVFAATIYFVQRKFFAGDRLRRIRLEGGRCLSCDSPLHRDAGFCSACGHRAGRNCPGCASPIRLADAFCWKCGRKVSPEQS